MARHRRLDWLVEGFFKEVEFVRAYTPRTVENYRWSLGLFLQFLEAQGVDGIDEVTPTVLAAYQTELVVKGGRQGQPLVAGARSHLISHVRQFFGYLVRQGHLLTNPAASMVIPKDRRKPPKRILNVAAMRRLLLAADVTSSLGLRDRAILELFYASGIRVTELIGLEDLDIDLVAQELLVRHGKGGRSRVVPVGEDACRWIRRYLDEGRPQLSAAVKERTMFLSYRGNRLTRAIVSKMVRTHAKTARIEFTVTPHSIRHTFASHLIQAGASLRHVQEMLGHQSLNSTQIYTQLDITDLKKTHRACHPRSGSGGEKPAEVKTTTTTPRQKR